jgi:hypothetical protein
VGTLLRTNASGVSAKQAPVIAILIWVVLLVGLCVALFLFQEAFGLMAVGAQKANQQVNIVGFQVSRTLSFPLKRFTNKYLLATFLGFVIYLNHFRLEELRTRRKMCGKNFTIILQCICTGKS